MSFITSNHLSTLSLVLYNSGIFLYGLALKLLSPFHAKAKLFVKGREDIFEKIKKELNNETQPKIWFHCASLGEFEQARPVIEEIRIRHPQYKIIITFFSPSGFEIRKNYDKADYIFYLPLDTASNAKKLIELFNPQMVFFVKYEFWYHYLSLLNKRETPIYLISANFRKDQVFFKWYGVFFRNILQLFEQIFTQNKSSAELLNTIGLTNVTISNDTRFDRVFDQSKKVKELPIIKEFKGDKLLLIAGSSYSEEENLIKNFLSANNDKNIRVIIAPHVIDESNINRIRNLFSDYHALFYSETNETDIHRAEVLIIDNIGMLSSVYQYGDIAFIGGGFGTKGLHNTLEAATFGMPVLFGPKNHDKFPEADLLIQNKIGFVIDNDSCFSSLMNEFINNPELRKTTGNDAKNFIVNNTGATGIILSQIRF